MRAVSLGTILVCLAMSGAPAIAANTEAPSQTEPLDEVLRGTAEQIVSALRLMVLAIPQYDAPEILENGDIIIRRRRTEPGADTGTSQDPEMGDAYQHDL